MQYIHFLVLNYSFKILPLTFIAHHYWPTSVAEPDLMIHWGQFHATSRVYINPSFCQQNHLPEEDRPLHLRSSSTPVIVNNRTTGWNRSHTCLVIRPLQSSCCIYARSPTDILDEFHFFTPQCCKVTSWPTSSPTDSHLPWFQNEGHAIKLEVNLLACGEAKA